MSTLLKRLIYQSPSLGVALGSGGARGLAHIGVLRVLEQSGHRVTHVAGSSMGALVGGFYAAGFSIAEIEALALKTTWKQIRSLVFDPSLRRGLLRGHKIVNFLEEHLGDKTFADCTIPLALAATDRLTGELVTLRDGRLVDAIRASISIPVLFEPVLYQNRELTDGGVSTPIPVAMARELGAQVVIAVNLDSHYFDQTVTPSWLDLVNDAFNISRHHLAALQAAQADVVLNIPADSNWYDFVNGAERINKGALAMQAALPEVQNALRIARPWWQRWLV